jgi:hypothetical protein
MADRKFHIAEWYGDPFHELADTARVVRAAHVVGGSAMKKDELDRLAVLEQKLAETSLTAREATRLHVLREKLSKQNEDELPCPFKAGRDHPVCTKKGGVCSIRLYEDSGNQVEPVKGDQGKIRSLCPWRFHQGHVAFAEIGKSLLGTSDPIEVSEVGFLESTGSLDSEEGKDVGRIDMVLLKLDKDDQSLLDWVAVEVQAVYFSGKRMAVEFDDIANRRGKLAMPVLGRRPDYRSSGVKRLMPQLLTKIPTLRRWGKKMAIVVDWAFYHSMGKMEQTKHISNADIAWFIADFVEDPVSGRYQLKIVDEIYTTLESATLGLTGGIPVAQGDFEARIKAKAGLDRLL